MALPLFLTAMPASAQTQSGCPAPFLPYHLGPFVLCHLDSVSVPERASVSRLSWRITSDDVFGSQIPPGVLFVSIGAQSWATEMRDGGAGPFEDTHSRIDIAGREYLYSDALTLFTAPVGIRCDPAVAHSIGAQRCFLRGQFGDDLQIWVHTTSLHGNWPLLDAEFAETWPEALRSFESAFGRLITLP